MECGMTEDRGVGGGGSFEDNAVCFHGSKFSCIFCHCIGVFFGQAVVHLLFL